jgi:transposase
VIFEASNAEAPELMSGEIEVDERYFAGQGKSKRERSVAGKVSVFGRLKRSDKVRVVIGPNAGSKTLIPIIREKIKPDRNVNSDRHRTIIRRCGISEGARTTPLPVEPPPQPPV